MKLLKNTNQIYNLLGLNIRQTCAQPLDKIRVTVHVAFLLKKSREGSKKTVMSALPYDPQGKASADATIVNKKISFNRNTMFPL